MSIHRIGRGSAVSREKNERRAAIVRRNVTAKCTFCGRRRHRALMKLDRYGCDDEWICRSAKDCDAAVEGP